MPQHPHIVVLDGYTLNPGDLNWDALKEIGPCAIYDRSTPAEVFDRAPRGGYPSHQQNRSEP